MATLSKHGHEVARFDYLRFILSFRSDGSILKNEGDGWKLARLKEGSTFEQCLSGCRERESKRSRAFLDYRRGCFGIPIGAAPDLLGALRFTGR
jgi:hypothetical protein